MKCTIDGLADTIQRELAAYNQEVTDGIKEDCKQVAKECRAEIKQNSPELTGDYKKGWRVKTNFESREDIRLTVHNKTDHQLTHLLEKGHAGVGGTAKGAAAPHPHIAPAEQHAAEKLINKAKTRIKG